MSWITSKVYYTIIYVIICIVSAVIAVCPGIIAACIPEDLMWIVFIMIGPCVGQIFFVTTPIISALEEYRNACSKRGLIHEQDIYKLFEKNGTAKLHVADIDQLPRYNVDIPNTKYQLVTETIPVVEDSDGTEREVDRSYVKCLHCGYTFPAAVIDDEYFRHCPSCSKRIEHYRVPRSWYEKRQRASCGNTTKTPESMASVMRRK